MTKITEPQPLAYSINEACRLSSLGPTFIRQAIRDQKLETRKVGRRRIILADSLRSFIEAREG